MRRGRGRRQEECGRGAAGVLYGRNDGGNSGTKREVSCAAPAAKLTGGDLICLVPFGEDHLQLSENDKMGPGKKK